MATPPKQARTSQSDTESVLGYLHSVSPVKVSRKNTRYFEASIQTGQEEYNRVVCFSPEKRAVCVQASENDQPVKLVDCRKAISHADAGSFDVLMMARSRIEAAEPLPFGRRELRLSVKKTVAEILTMGPRQKIGSVDLKILQSTGNNMVPINGEPMEVKTFSVCDPTGHTSLNVWGNHIVTVLEGKSYKFQGLATRKSADVTIITTTPTTVISIIQEVSQPASMAPLPARLEQTVRGQVIGVQIEVKPRCRRCHYNQDHVGQKSTTHRCEKCKILQLTTSYTFTYTGVLVVQTDGPEFSGTLTNSAVFKYVGDNFLSASAHDGCILEEHVIGQGEVEVTTNAEGLVLAIMPVGSGEASASLWAESNSEDLGDLLDSSDNIDA